MEKLRAQADQRFSRAELDVVLASDFRWLRFPDTMEKAFQAADAIEFASFRRIALLALIITYIGAASARLLVNPNAETVITVAQFGVIVPGSIALIVGSYRAFGMAHFKTLFTLLVFLATGILFFRYELGELGTPYVLPVIFAILFTVLFGLRLTGFRRACLLTAVIFLLYYNALFLEPELPDDINVASETIVFFSAAINMVMGYLLEHRQRRNFLVNRRLEEAEREAREARELAERANAAKSQFLAIMNHELRTPLTVIIGYNDLLRQEAAEQKMTHLLSDLDKVQNAAQHLLGLINDIIDFSKIEAGRMEVELRDFSLAAMVADVRPLIEPLMARNKNRFEVNCPADIGTMRSDETKVRQILINLLGNAAKFTDRGAVCLGVRRQCAEDGEAIEFTVSDTGVGITPGHLERLFTPFVQADASTTRKYGGTGLGLAITERFCKLLGGRIAVTSEPGKGSTFVVTLPAISAGIGEAESVTDRDRGKKAVAE